MGDIIVIGQNPKKAESERPPAALRLPLKIDGRAGFLCIPQGLGWTPIQKFLPHGVEMYGELGPGWIEWEDEKTDD